ncbi:AbrB/MazE/SpoVT family DNA-binding domain-containing protein [Candidatus Pacearchaeota archaeon]|nr:AbrB/MazE/SpoVT family DNA-binding domain-containing protein [Candidatus Pacearchaeota archaeon]
MVIRKLVKQGAATLMVSIPAKWAKQNNLEKGSQVEVEESNSILKITTPKEKTKKEIILKITEENKKDIQNILTHAYREGFQIIKIENINKEIIREAQQIVDKMLLGFEITSRSEKECIIENVSEPSNKKYPELLKRVMSLIKETHVSVVQDVKFGKYVSSSEVQAMREHLDKLVLFCRRVLLNESEKEVVLSWELLTFLMHIEHKYYYLYEYAKTKKFKADKEILDIFEDLEKYYAFLDNTITNKDITSIHKINILKKEYHFGKIPRLIEKANGKKAMVLCHINELFRLIQISSSPVLSIILNIAR